MMTRCSSGSSSETDEAISPSITAPVTAAVRRDGLTIREQQQPGSGSLGDAADPG
jgi:hypothetical protein